MTGDEAVALLDSSGIESAWVFGYPLPDSREQNRYVFAESKKYQTRLSPVPIIGDDLEKWLCDGAIAVKEHVYGQRRKWEFDSSWTHQYRAVESAGVPLIIHLGPDAVERLSLILNCAPGLRIIAAHLGWHFEWGKHPTCQDVEPILQFLAEHGLSADTSALGSQDADVIALAREMLGDERVLWGSDTPTDGVLLSRAMVEAL